MRDVDEERKTRKKKRMPRNRSFYIVLGFLPEIVFTAKRVDKMNGNCTKDRREPCLSLCPFQSTPSPHPPSLMSE